MYKRIHRHLSIHSKLLNENTSDNEWMIIGILLHWYYSIDWATLVWCICEHMFIWTNETPLGVSKIFNIQKGEPFSTGGGIIITNPRAYKWEYIRNKLVTHIHESHTPWHTMVYKPRFYLWFHTYNHITYVENNRKNYRENNRSYWLSKIWNIIWNNRIFQLGLTIWWAIV